MYKLEGGQTHHHSPTGLAVKTPTKVMEAMDHSPEQDAFQETGSHTLSEDRHNPDLDKAPQNTWSDNAETHADKRRKMNRESARRTRQRKQQQTASLKEEVAQLKAESLRSNERMRAITEKNQDLFKEAQSRNQHNQMLIKCLGELTVVCKRKQGVIEHLRHRIQTAEKLSDIPVPEVDQVEDQLSLDSLRLLQTSPLQPARAGMPASQPAAPMPTPQAALKPQHPFASSALTYMAPPAALHTAAPARMQGGAADFAHAGLQAESSAYPSVTGQEVLQSLGHKSASLPIGTRQADLLRSTGLQSTPGISSVDLPPDNGKAAHDGAPYALAAMPVYASGFGSSTQGVTERAATEHLTAEKGHASAPPSLLSDPRLHQASAKQSAARNVLIAEAARSQQGLMPGPGQYLADHAAPAPVQQATGTSALSQDQLSHPITEARELMSRSLEWRVSSWMSAAAQQKSALQIPKLDAGHQVHLASFQQTPLQHRNGYDLGYDYRHY